MIRNAFQNMLKRPPTEAEINTWKSRVEVYSEISRKIDRTPLINAAYKKSMGRDVNGYEWNKWVPRSENEQQIIAANRALLWSSNGASDLRQTIIRAYEKVKGKKPNDIEINLSVQTLKDKKSIYDEMLVLFRK